MGITVFVAILHIVSEKRRHIRDATVLVVRQKSTQPGSRMKFERKRQDRSFVRIFKIDFVVIRIIVFSCRSGLLYLLEPSSVMYSFG